jgi:hypothetical protein
LRLDDGGFADQKQFLAWAKRARPDAVVGFSSWSYWELLEVGYRIPDQLGLLTLHHAGTDVRDGLADLDENSDEVARPSVLLLDQLIRNRETGVPPLPLNGLVPSIWREGTSVRQLADGEST